MALFISPRITRIKRHNSQCQCVIFGLSLAAPLVAYVYVGILTLIITAKKDFWRMPVAFLHRVLQILTAGLIVFVSVSGSRILL